MNKQGRCNTRVKIYDDSVTITCFNYPAFNPNGLATTKQRRTNYSKSTKPELRSDSLKRSKDKIFDIAKINEWEWFITLTIDPGKIDSYDASKVVNAFKVWLSNMAQRNEMQYLFVPELHKSGRIHFHGLAKGNFKMSFSGKHDKSNRPIFNLENWKYGFTTAIKLDNNKDAVARYITKYVTKELQKVLPNFYYAGGKGLKRCPDMTYLDMDYNKFNGREYPLGYSDFIKVKYRVDHLNEDN